MMLSSMMIIGIWIFVGVLSFSFFTTTKENHYRFRSLYTIASMSVFQAILGMYFLVSGDAQYQEVRWLTFTLMESQFLNFAIRDTKKRHLQLLIQTVFYFVLLMSQVHYSLIMNFLIAGILVAISITSPVEIIKKHFSISFALYFLTALVPAIVGFTTNISLFMGVIFSAHFAWGVFKMYTSEKVKDEIELQIRTKIEKEYKEVLKKNE